MVKKQNYEEAANLRDKEKRILTKLENEKVKFEQELLTSKKEVLAPTAERIRVSENNHRQSR